MSRSYSKNNFFCNTVYFWYYTHKCLQSVTTLYGEKSLIIHPLSADFLLEQSQLWKGKKSQDLPEHSLKPYISITGMFKLWKNSRVSFIIGAAEARNNSQRSRPRARRTAPNMSQFANVQPYGTLPLNTHMTNECILYVTVKSTSACLMTDTYWLSVVV